MEKLTGKCLEAFLIFLIEHFRKYRPDYNILSDETIIAKFQRRHLLDQYAIMSIFFNEKTAPNEAYSHEEMIEMSTRDIVEFNEEFNLLNK